MSTTIVPAAPAFGRVTGIQFRLLLLARRPLILGAFVLAVLAFVEYLAYSRPDRLIAVTSITPAGIGLGILWGLVVWTDEGPRKRRYHWSMPVDTALHDIARVAAGALWLLLGLCVLYLAGIGFAMLRGAAAPALDAGPALWINLLSAPLTVYLMVAGLGILTNRPLEILLLVWLVVAFASGVAVLSSVPWLQRLIEVLVGGASVSLRTALTGGSSLANGDAAPDATITGWLMTATSWLLFAGAAVVAASYRHRGRT